MHLSEPTMDQLLKNGRSKFANILAASKRARQLQDGSEKLLEEYEGHKSVSKALEEVAAGKIVPDVEEE
ncbi:DNA-directed RNA polymerase subunit omega [Halanaerobaculum tunisiense]